jgi:hypothetical protein
MEILFWTTVGLLVHTYVLYPLSLPVLSLFCSFKRKQGNSNKFKVSMVIAAHNEEKVIEEKIRNTFDLDFPRKNLEILIGSDASSDRTNAIVSKHAPDVKLFAFNQRGGKAAVLNQLVPRASGDILVFCDANTMLLRNALQKLLSHFEDPSVGCVCGRLILHDAGHSALGVGESIYWNLESEIKKLEGKLGIVIGANGGIYAIRRELFERIPVDKTVMDDFPGHRQRGNLPGDLRRVPPQGAHQPGQFQPAAQVPAPAESVARAGRVRILLAQAVALGRAGADDGAAGHQRAPVGQRPPLLRAPLRPRTVVLHRGARVFP